MNTEARYNYYSNSKNKPKDKREALIFDCFDLLNNSLYINSKKVNDILTKCEAEKIAVKAYYPSFMEDTSISYIAEIIDGFLGYTKTF